jgi:hypothetical protein
MFHMQMSCRVTGALKRCGLQEATGTHSVGCILILESGTD